MSDLERRFEKLERQNRHYRVALICVCLVAATAFGMTAWPPTTGIIKADTVECRSLKIMSGQELQVELAAVGYRAGGYLSFFDHQNGRPVVFLGSSYKGGHLGIYDRQSLASMFYNPYTHDLVLSNQDGARVVRAYADSIGNGVVEVSDREGKLWALISQ